MVKLLIVDDSALMRKCLSDIFKAEPGFELQTARNGAEALSLAQSWNPDVITLDVNMPEMDGITCLSEIMVKCPKPVVMVSSLTHEDAEVTLQALGLGAVDYVPKPDGTVSLHLDKIRAVLVAKVRAAAQVKLRLSKFLLKRVRHAATASPPPRRLPEPKPFRPLPLESPGTEPPGLILIGVSTGGPSTLEQILPLLPVTLPWPVVVAQHMPETFTGVFARRMDGLSELRVCEASRPLPLCPGHIYIARGDADMLITRRCGVLTALPTPAAANYYWHPSVDRLVRSAMEHLPPQRLVAVQLTGMGDDGAEAIAKLHAEGGRTIAEAEETAVVWGMPGELVKRNGASVVLPVHKVAEQIRRWVS